MKRKRREKDKNLTELGLKLRVDLVKSAAKSEELFASFLGDKELSHAFPINVLRCFEGDIGYLLRNSTHFFVLCIFLSLLSEIHNKNGGNQIEGLGNWRL